MNNSIANISSVACSNGISAECCGDAGQLTLRVVLVDSLSQDQASLAVNFDNCCSFSLVLVKSAAKY